MIKKLLEEFKSHPYIQNPSPDLNIYREFKKIWFELGNHFWELTRGSQASYEEAVKIPHINSVFSSKSGLLVYIVTHDINSTFLYYLRHKDQESGEYIPSFNFLEFWEDSMVRVLEVMENFICGEDSNSPETLIYKTWSGKEGCLVERKTSVYNIPGTSWWREAEFITSPSQAHERLGRSKNLLEDYIKYEEDHYKKYGWRSEVFRERINNLQIEIDTLTGKIKNSESNWLILKYED